MTSPEAAIDRPTVRVVLLDEQDRLLLFRTVKGDLETGKPVWFPPGGGIESGETDLKAAHRELFEELGWRDVPIGPLLWHRCYTWPWRGQWYRAHERYYLARVVCRDIDASNRTQVELEELAAHQWWTLDEILASEDIFVPRQLAELLPRVLSGTPAEPLTVE